MNPVKQVRTEFEENVRDFLERSIKKAQQPDLKYNLKKEREKRKQLVLKKFGF